MTALVPPGKTKLQKCGLQDGPHQGDQVACGARRQAAGLCARFRGGYPLGVVWSDGAVDYRVHDTSVDRNDITLYRA